MCISGLRSYSSMFRECIQLTKAAKIPLDPLHSASVKLPQQIRLFNFTLSSRALLAFWLQYIEEFLFISHSCATDESMVRRFQTTKLDPHSKMSNKPCKALPKTGNMTKLQRLAIIGLMFWHLFASIFALKLCIILPLTTNIYNNFAIEHSWTSNAVCRPALRVSILQCHWLVCLHVFFWNTRGCLILFRASAGVRRLCAGTTKSWAF